MKKWIFSGIFYLLIVVTGYWGYTNFIADEKTADHEMAEESAGHGSEHESEDNDDNHKEEHGAGNSDVQVDVSYIDGNIEISLKNKNNQPVDKLEVNHEKLLHLIVVNEHLDQYYHLHPEQTGEGTFTVKKDFEEGSYKAFVDIKPKDLSYEVKPIPFKVGNPDTTHGHNGGLEPDKEHIQTIDQETVEMEMSSMNAGEPVTLTFKLNETNLQPYLGAMGHVVILDEEANQYLHVHPADHDKPIFETEFHEPGIYKIWAEFKQDGKVRAFPFIVEIK
ncbi:MULTISPECIES: hypothetical protein [unclassified Bacillus (in: firmicutes)]|uniref:hypothetical protein n=1 Tax=unclassified Bacillus (in: firmicutes) TaxID=185979 RepID=UPI0008EF8B24|nr:MULTISPECIES: hypothetical protein [unclassified Bacillus (in: firmicutes)]SFB13331.1 hypothetical protein SAMN02799634_106188 [Bacillus sp. UNCCL13]SFQ90042.1 hypothetical protein SAMN04488577_3631 [Bacillus sp. cl95]